MFSTLFKLSGNAFQSLGAECWKDLAPDLDEFVNKLNSW